MLVNLTGDVRKKFFDFFSGGLVSVVEKVSLDEPVTLPVPRKFLLVETLFFANESTLENSFPLFVSLKMFLIDQRLLWDGIFMRSRIPGFLSQTVWKIPWDFFSWDGKLHGYSRT